MSSHCDSPGLDIDGMSRSVYAVMHRNECPVVAVLCAGIGGVPINLLAVEIGRVSAKIWREWQVHGHMGE